MFCKYCGTNIPEGYVCNCPQAAAERAAQMRAAAPVQQAPVQQAPAYQPPVPPVKPAKPPKPPRTGPSFGEQMGAAFKNIPNTFKSLLKNTEGEQYGLATTILMSGAILIVNILAWLFIAIGVRMHPKDIYDYIWGYVGPNVFVYGILGAFITTILPMGLTFGGLLAIQAIKKEKINIIAAYCTSSCISLLPAAIFLVGGLLYMLLPVLGYFFFIISIVANLAANYKLLAKVLPETGSILGSAMAAGIIGTVFAICAAAVYFIANRMGML